MAKPSTAPRVILSEKQAEKIIEIRKRELLKNENIISVSLGYYTDKRFNKYCCMNVKVKKYEKGLLPYSIDDLVVCVSTLADP